MIAGLRRILVCLAALAPPAAFAQCPASPEDLATGISLTFADGTSSVMSRDDDGLIVEQAEYNDGSGLGFRSLSKYGFAIVELSDTENGEPILVSVERYEYLPLGLDIFTAPTDEAMMFGTTRVTLFPDGKRLEEEVTYQTRFYEERDWGGCRYRVLPIHIARFASDDSSVEVYDYIPDLEAAILVAILEADVAVMDASPVSITTVVAAN